MNGQVWGVNSVDEVFFRYKGMIGPWHKTVGSLRQIDIGADGRIWGLNYLNLISTRASVGAYWEKIDGLLMQIDVSNDGRLWGVDYSKRIWTRSGLIGTWQFIDGDNFTNISA